MTVSAQTNIEHTFPPPSRGTEAIVERMGRHFEAEGVPRIGGRLYGYLLLQDEPRSLDELAEALQVSKTSVSSNSRLLETTRLIERVTKPGDRRDYYQAADDQTGTLEFRLQHVREMVDLLEEALAEVPASRPKARERLSTMESFTREALEVLEALLESWRSRKPS